MKKKWLIGGAGALVVVGLAGGWLIMSGSSAKDAKPGDGKDGKSEVALEFTGSEVVRPRLARLPDVVEFSGPLVAPGTAIVRAKAAGTLISLAVAEGSRVTAGQALGRVDLAELASRVAERDAQVVSARAKLAQAERAFASDERLAQQKFISDVALDNSRAALDTARASLAAAQASAGSLKVSLRDASLVAPISGIVAKRWVVPGEKLAAEQQLLSIVDLKTLELAGTVGTHQVSRLAPGMPVQLDVEGSAGPVEARIARIAPAAEPGTRAIGVTIALANPKETFRAGQYAVARAVLADDTERLTVPATAIGSTAGQDHVWVIENGLLARRAITVGRRDGREGRVEVLTGLAPQAQVLAARFDNLREGAKAAVVAIKSAPGQEGADRSAPVASASASTPRLQ